MEKMSVYHSLTNKTKGTSNVGLYQCIHIEKLVCAFFPFSATAPRLFIVSDLQDFTLLALNHLTADPYNDYRGISEPGSLYNVIFLHFSVPVKWSIQAFVITHSCVMADPQLSQQAVLDSISHQLSVFLSQSWAALRAYSQLKDRDTIIVKSILLYYLKYSMCFNSDYLCK